MYRQEFLLSVILFLQIMPLVERGVVNLFPDPCNFNSHLRDQMFSMAKFRSKGLELDPKEEAGFVELMKEQQERSMLLMPRDALRRQVSTQSPEMDEGTINAVLDGFDRLREQDPLAVLQEGSLEGGKGGGQLLPLKMSPNFEIGMYLAQATGSCIVTDSVFRWRELIAAAKHAAKDDPPLAQLQSSIEKAEFLLPCDSDEITTLVERGKFASYPAIMRKVLKYLTNVHPRGRRPNLEDSLNAEFKRIHTSTTRFARTSGLQTSQIRVSCLFPSGGIQDNNVNRLLLMSSSEHHLDGLPMALFFHPPQTP